MFAAFGIPPSGCPFLPWPAEVAAHPLSYKPKSFCLGHTGGSGGLLYNLLSPTRDVLRLRQTSLRGGRGGLGGQLPWSVSLNPSDTQHTWTWARRLANSQKRGSTAQAKQCTSVTYGHLLRGWCWVQGGSCLCLVPRFTVPAHELIVQTKAGWVWPVASNLLTLF